MAYPGKPHGKNRCHWRAFKNGIGTQCRNWRKAGSQYCWRHDRIIYGWHPTEAAAEAIRQGNDFAAQAQKRKR